MKKAFRVLLINNLLWFSGALLVSFFIWTFATFQNNPIQQEWFPQAITVELAPDDGLLLTSPPRTAQVFVRAPQGVLQILSANEIRIWADLSGLPAGDHSVPLQASLARSQAQVIDIRPAVLRITLEAQAEKLLPLTAQLTGTLPAGYAHGEPSFDLSLNQVQVSGPQSIINRVAATVVEIDLTEQRNPLQLSSTVYAVASDGTRLSTVAVTPATVGVHLAINRREDVREIAVRPNLSGTLPTGYVLKTLSYTPQTLLVSGAPEALANLSDTLATRPIDLRNHTNSFETTIELAQITSAVVVLSDPTIQVSIEIAPIQTSKQLSNLPIEIQNLSDGLTAKLTPQQVTVLLNGPQPLLDNLSQSDILVVVNLTGLGVGNYTLQPSINLVNGELTAEDIAVLPAEIDIALTAKP